MASAAPRLSPADTKTRILDAAETLFVQGGFESMSMRQITSAAGVNLAAANYHFGSKDALIQAVLARQLDPLNEHRLAMLAVLEQHLGENLRCEHVLVAMFLPAVRMGSGRSEASRRYLHFLGRAYTDPSPVVREFIDTHYVQTLARFFFAFQRTLPDLAREDLGFRLNFAMGALAGILAGGNTQRLIREFTQGHRDDEAMILSRLVALMVAALRAPLPGPSETNLIDEIVHLPGLASLGLPPETAQPPAPAPDVGQAASLSG